MSMPVTASVTVCRPASADSLNENETRAIAAPPHIDQKLERADVVVTHALGELDRCRGDAGTDRLRKSGAGAISISF
jgi:hypothetical protein